MIAYAEEPPRDTVTSLPQSNLHAQVLELSGHGIPVIVGPLAALLGGWNTTPQNYQLLTNFVSGLLTGMHYLCAVRGSDWSPVPFKHWSLCSVCVVYIESRRMMRPNESQFYG